MSISADLETLMTFAHLLADASGAAIMPHFRKALTIENKRAAGFDPVTIADKAAESTIRALIEEHCPDHGILGEEHGEKKAQSNLTWVIDPIDGTRAFMTGSPMWGTLIALNDNGQPVLGILDQPFLRERFYGTAQASFCRDSIGQTKLQTRKGLPLGQAVLSTTHPGLFAAPSEKSAFESVAKWARMTQYGGDCYAYALLAMGFIDIVIEVGLKPYDIQALIPVIEGAGGVVTNWRGGSAANGGQIIACGDARLHQEVLELVVSAAA
jgi:myo-inositol-1(or 4)-monophosphatase